MEFWELFLRLHPQKMVFHRANSAGSLQHPIETPATQCGAGSQWQPGGFCGQHHLKFQGQWWEDCAECYHPDNRLVCQCASHCMVIWKMLLHKLFGLGSALAKVEWWSRSLKIMFEGNKYKNIVLYLFTSIVHILCSSFICFGILPYLYTYTSLYMNMYNYVCICIHTYIYMFLYMYVYI